MSRRLGRARWEIRSLENLHDSRWSLATLAAAAAPLLAAPLVDPDLAGARDVVTASGVVTWVAVLFADVLMYLHWRMVGGPAGWVVLALTTLTVQSLALATLVQTDPDALQNHPTRVLVLQAATAVAALVLVPWARDRELRLDPLLGGTLVGAAVVVVRYFLVTQTEPLRLAPGSAHWAVGLVLILDLAIAFALFRLMIAPMWVRARLASALALLSLGHAAAYPVPDGAVLGAVALVANILGGSLLLSLAATLLRGSWSQDRATMEALSTRLVEVEATARLEKGRLHELRATIAGLSAASKLIHQSAAVSPARRAQIESMMDSEMDRLRRLLTDARPGRPTPVDVDATIRPLVMRHQALGHAVRWEPSGTRVLGRPDHVAEVVSILLENALQHAPGADVSITAAAVDDTVEVAVSDSGPGVPSELGSAIFEWGERGATSSGHGIGLHVARQLATELGGDLRLLDSSPGATFVLALPTEDPA